jgi:Brp/Blh family beta-carotene 15,15'-monooxygenase
VTKADASVSMDAPRAPLPIAPPNGLAIMTIGVVAVGLTLLIVTVTGSTAAPTSAIPTWVTVAALVALLFGIPHGAVDHLLLRTELSRRQWIFGSLAYGALAAIAVVFILIFPAAAFIGVIAATVWHFGSGDVEASCEMQGLPAEKGVLRFTHALAAGSAPVLIPLTSPLAMETLITIQPELAGLLNSNVLYVTRTVVFVLIVVVLIQLIHRGQVRNAIELVVLTALGMFATPLLAFAVYFSAWHALRHTARIALDQYGVISVGTINRVFMKGLPALLGTILIIGTLVLLLGFATISTSWLWFGLVIVWGLTVPHMSIVAAYDRRVRR